MKRLAKRAIVVPVSERECRPIGGAEIRPKLRRPLPVAGELRRVRFGTAEGDVLFDARPPAPDGELADGPSRPAPLCQLERGLGGLSRSLGAALQPGGLGSRGSNPADSLELS